MVPPAPTSPSAATRWQQFSSATVRGFHAYASWLVSITWRRFIVLALALLVFVGIVHDMPPFTFRVTEEVPVRQRKVVVQPPRPPVPPVPPTPGTETVVNEPGIVIEAPAKGSKAEGVDISIGRDGIRITPKASKSASAAAEAASQANAAASSALAMAEQGIVIKLPDGVTSEAVREAVREARQQIEESLREARQDAEQAVRDAAEAKRDAEAAVAELSRAEDEAPRTRTRTRRYGPGDLIMQLTVWWVLGSVLLKFTYKGRLQAEVKAAKATETAESESLKRQVVEARMAAMQAQVEPHFLFNTLASIDHLIETDPPRASLMQKNLIALLRASMPSMREVNSPGGANPRDLGRELAVIRPYLEILKVRMEERLSTEIRVSDGLMSAEFPPMMLQSLVENAIKHGLEPKADGGRLTVSADVVHGKLAVTVADTGLGFGKAATAGTGIGLSNIRERLQLLYGGKAGLKVTENPGGGTAVTITVPYQSTNGGAADA